MEIQIEGKPLALAVPSAATYFETAETLKSLGIIALIQGVAKKYEDKIKELQVDLENSRHRLQEATDKKHELELELELVRTKLSRPKAGRTSLKKSGARVRRMAPEDADDTTKELMEEAYSGKKPHSKSEMRRLAVMKEKDNE